MDGIINVYKEKGFTSHDVVAKLRGILKQKKIGHTGTLDPDATGVLLVCLGKATKVCDMITNKNKVYETTLLLGTITDTQDSTGKVLRESIVNVSEKEIREVIYSFLGEYEQIPPMYSALKVNGKKLYELARQGKVVERKPRKVHIFTVEIKDINLQTKEVHMAVECSKGTYIRTLCYDIGEALGCGGCMKELIRTKVGNFSIQESLSLTEIEQLEAEKKLLEKIYPIEELFSELPKVYVSEDDNKLLYNGNPLILPSTEEKIRVYDTKEKFIAIYYYESAKQRYRPLKMFQV